MPWDLEAISQGEWGGVSLYHVLELAGIRPGLAHVAFTCLLYTSVRISGQSVESVFYYDEMCIRDRSKPMRPMMRNSCSSRARSVSSVRARSVSYTHLDVYKRQDLQAQGSSERPFPDGDL